MVRCPYRGKSTEPPAKGAPRQGTADRRVARRTSAREISRIATLGAVICITAAAAVSAPARAGEQYLNLAIENGQIAEPAPTLRVVEGDAIVIRFTSDRPAEVHLHGYDLEIAVAPGADGILRFEATATGRFPAELHDDGGGSHGALFYLEVHPR